ncbi:hypothetical protein EMPS_03866 [Entomortierella parvispora]|uniref:FAD-binding domain-containing protein n=1 Tax=Entomortierella parvispora TaxID=205924 RepID=A0A9P3LUU6_9FUNG|nr:hypothetical protein EMPS_03866 [Entomortierella parvispora]
MSPTLETLDDPVHLRCNLDDPPVVSNEPPKVLISGAGLAGLLLGNILEKAGIPYVILERAKEIKPLGAVMALSPSIQPVFEQLGIFEELMKVSYPVLGIQFLNEDMSKIGEFDSVGHDAIAGYDTILFTRSELYDILYSRIPSDKIHLCKRVLNFTQSERGVMVRCQDGSTFSGDVLVAADGAHSAVRHHLYSMLDSEDKLPAADKRQMTKGYACLVGTTCSLDPEKYPGIEKPSSSAAIVIADKSPYTWCTYSVPGNKICWNVVMQLNTADVKDELERNSEWSANMNDKMLQEVKDYMTPFGTVGQLIEETPKEVISKVFFEDLLYRTWHHGRTVLIGDAAHKLLPSTGQGAVNALQDAVILGNCLYEVQPTSHQNIQKCFQSFRKQRYDHVKASYEASRNAAKLQYGHTFSERLLRQIIFGYLPNWVQRRQVQKDSAYRPQISFLPLTPQRGSAPVLPQIPSERYAREQKKVEDVNAMQKG